MPEELTNRELGMKIDDLQKETVESLDRIEKQTTQTNGRVKKLELWQQFLLGAWAAGMILIPIIYFLLKQQIVNYQVQNRYETSQAIELNNEKYFKNP